MIARTTSVRSAERSQPERHDRRARMPGKTGSRGTEFDPHHRLERYRVSHDDSDAADALAGVPFN